MTKGKNQCCMYMKKNLSDFKTNLKENQFDSSFGFTTVR